MIGLRSRTISASSVTSRRSTPCVAGWCGPMLRVSSSRSGAGAARGWARWVTSRRSPPGRGGGVGAHVEGQQLLVGRGRGQRLDALADVDALLAGAVVGGRDVAHRL